jgi:hypothetical protein
MYGSAMQYYGRLRFRVEHAIFGPPPHRNPLTDRYEILHTLITLARSRDVQKMITIGSVGSAPHISEIYSYRRYLLFLFFRTPTCSPNGNNLDHNASIDADFLKEVPFGGLEICKENCRIIFAPKNLKFFLTLA